MIVSVVVCDMGEKRWWCVDLVGLYCLSVVVYVFCELCMGLRRV